MKKQQQQRIECGRCGESRQEVLSAEDAGTLSDAIGPIYRECVRCEKTTGWVIAAIERQPLKGNERIATQAEREKVNVMVQDIG